MHIADRSWKHVKVCIFSKTQYPVNMAQIGPIYS